MLYNRAIYDLASIVKLVVDKISPGDRFQVLALLKNIKLYLETCDISLTVVFDEPLVTVNNLIHNIEDVNSIKQPIQGVEKSQKSQSSGSSKAAGNTSQVKTLFSTPRESTPARPPVSRRAAVKRPPQPPDSDSESDCGDYGGDDDDASDSDDNQPQQVQEQVVYDETEWQPIDVLEQVLSATVNEQQAKTQYFFDGTASKNKGKSKGKKKSTKPMAPKLYLPDDVEFANPTPRNRATGERKWPENTKWVCYYCRLITKNLKAYKQHLRLVHRKEDPCSCRFCKREMPSVELLSFHTCKGRNQCNVCFKNFNTTYHLRRHLATHFKSFLVTVMCGICETGFASANECARHVYDDHETIVICDSCLCELDPHESTATDPARLYCPKCSMSATGVGEPEALPQNPNADIVIRSTRIKMYGETNGDQVSGDNDQTQHCDVCDMTFTSKFPWKKHMTSTRHIKAVAAQTGDKCPEHPCSQCGKMFISAASLQRHIRSNHTGLARSESYICKICGKELMTLGGYKNHVAAHVNAKTHKCQQCDKAYNRYGSLQDHMDNVHQSEKTFACTICGEKFQSRKKRTKHINLVHDNYYYQCPECEYGTRNGDVLKTHIAWEHIDVKWTKPIDYRQVSTEPYVPGETMDRGKTRHRQSAPGAELIDSEPMELTCEICDINFAARDHLHRHQHTKIHLTKKAALTGASLELFKCDECKKEFVSLKKLKGHHDRIHNEDGVRFTCDKCGKQISTISGYKKHMLVHSGVKNIKCKDCDMAFFDRPALRDHEAVIHMRGEFPCQECGEVFSNRRRRYKHMDRVHHNYVYKCTDCAFRSKTKVAFENHFLNMHPDDTMNRSLDYRHDEPLGLKFTRSARYRKGKRKISEDEITSISSEDTSDIDLDETMSSAVDDEEDQQSMKGETSRAANMALADSITLADDSSTQSHRMVSLVTKKEAFGHSPPSAASKGIKASRAGIVDNTNSASDKSDRVILQPRKRASLVAKKDTVEESAAPAPSKASRAPEADSFDSTNLAAGEGDAEMKQQQRFMRALLVAKKEPPSSEETTVAAAPATGSLVGADVAADKSDSGLKPPLRKYSTRSKRTASDRNPVQAKSTSSVVATPKLKQSK